jgi:hypothetical protein
MWGVFRFPIEQYADQLLPSQVRTLEPPEMEVLWWWTTASAGQSHMQIAQKRRPTQAET